MNTLHIPQIFAQFEYYQQHYLTILADSAQYYTPVADAFIDVWPLKKRVLYLGELLELWFAEKWRLEAETSFSLAHFLSATSSQATSKDLYIYAITGNAFTGANQAQVWQRTKQCSQTELLSHLTAHVLQYKALSRPAFVSALRAAVLPKP